MDVRPLSLMGSLESVRGGAGFSFLVLGTHQTRLVEGRVRDKASLQVLLSFLSKILKKLI